MDTRKSEEKYVRRIYRQIIALALAAHIIYIFIFIYVGLPFLAAYNVASVLFYSLMFLAVGRGYYRLAVSCIHLEVITFVIVCTLTAGWEIGIALYLIAVTSLVYFCPYKHKCIPYLFAAVEICVFVILRLYTGLVRPGYLAVTDRVGLWLYLYDACACFAFILFAAFSSKVSAAVSRQELKDENKSLSALANYDQLTGLLSRYAFLSRLELLRGRQIVLALSDIDDFKRVNDTYGHMCGDQVLIESAELIRVYLGRGVNICRWGGEEFVYLFWDLPLEEVLKKVQGVCDAIANHIFRWNELELHITMTFGVSPDSGGISAEELVALADRQMYEGKLTGKNKVVCSGSKTDEKTADGR